MRIGLFSLVVSALLLCSAIPASANPKVRRGSSSSRMVKSKVVKPKVSIEPERATEIQTALIKAGYLSGAPSGTWDASTEAAMGKLQADNGWQTKFVPDSRGLIKLGLGPSPQAASGMATAPAVETHDEPAAEPPMAAPAANNR